MALTSVIELPHNLAVPAFQVWTYRRGEPFEGWTPDQMGGLVGLPVAVENDRVPTHRISFRQTRMRSRLPLRAADKTFGAWVRPLLPWRERVLRRINYTRRVIGGYRPQMTVAAVTEFIPTAGLSPDDFDVNEKARDAVDVLNEFLVCLGIQSNDALVGPLALADLPAIAPVVFEVQPVETGRRDGGQEMAVLHDWAPVLLDEPRARSEIDAAASMFRAQREGGEVLFQVLELSHTARREATAGRFGIAVLLAGTAVEVMFTAIMHEGWTARGLRPQALNGALNSGFRNVVTMHAGRVLGVSLDVDDPETAVGRWWAKGYALRNRVAHTGYRPTLEETLDALDATYGLVTWVGQLLENDTVLQIKTQLPSEREPSQRYGRLAEAIAARRDGAG